MDPAKLKVVELRAELSARGLDTKGVKAVLVDRLKQALKEETGQEVPDTSIVDTSTEDFGTVEEKTSQSEPEQTSETEQTSEAEQERVPTPDQERVPTPEPERVPSPEPERVPSPEPERVPSPEQERVPTPEPEREPTPDPEKKEEEHSKSEEQISEEPTSAEVVEEKNEKENITEDTKMEEVSVKKEPEYEDFKQNFEEKPNFGDYQQGYDDENKEHYEADVKMEPGTEIKEEDQEQDRKRKRSRWSPQQQKQGWGQSTGWTKKDDEPELDDKAVVLGWYDSDLNLVIEKSDFLEAAPLSSQGFGYVWAGCRATFGFNQGKVCFEVKLLENLDVSHLEDEPSPHVLRVGWSVLSASLMLGEEPMSFGYGGTAKASTNCKFNNYGTTFVVGDTVTAYLDYGSRVKISYAVNGKYLGEAFNIPSSQINEQPLFPHLLSKNIKFRVNFGQTETEFPIEAGYTWAANVAEDQRVAGPRRPERREDCEMLMMCGLPGCGKTTWANAFVKEHPDKYYNILGTNSLIEKMKIQGLARKRNYHGRWDVLIDKCTKCLNKLLEMAAGRRRNYILDQTNVYPSAQKRKMRNFGGFVRRAIVIVPTDEEFQRRCAKREAEEGKDIPDSAVLEMKANFRLPEQGEFFDEVRYIELNEEESRPLVEQYNKEGRAAGFGQQAPFSNQGSGGGSGGKRFRGAPPRGGSGGGGFRGGNRGGGGFGGVLDRRGDRPGGDRGGGGFRSGGMDRGGRGGWQPRGGGGDRGGRGGWRDRSPGGGGGYDRDMDNRGPGGGPWRNNRNNDHRDRPYDRNQRGGRGGRGGGGFDRNNFRDNEGGYGGRGGGGFRDNDYNRGGSGSGGSGSGYDRDDYNNRGGGGGGYNQRDSGYNNRDGGFRDGGGRGRGGGGGGRGSFDRDQRGGGRGGFDRNRGGYNDRRGGGGGNRDGGYDRNRGGPDRGPRDNKGGNSGNQNNQGGGGGGGGQGWGNQGYNSGWGQGGGGYNNQQQQQPQGYNQGSGGGYNQGGGGGGFNQGGGGGGGYNQQGNQPPATGWGQQAWANKGGYGTGANQQQPAQAPPTGTTPTATPAATGYNTTGGYTPQQTGYNQAQYPQGYWGQYGYGQGWTQNADGTYSYPQGWQQYGYNYGQAGAAAAMATPAAAVGNPAAATQPAAK